MKFDSFGIFFLIWIVLGLGFAAAMHGPLSAQAKRRIFYGGTILAGVLFAGFITWQWWPNPPWLFYPAIVLITVLNLRWARFCEACGAYQQRLFRAPWQSIRPSAHCVRCGKKVA